MRVDARENTDAPEYLMLDNHQIEKLLQHYLGSQVEIAPSGVSVDQPELFCDAFREAERARKPTVFVFNTARARQLAARASQLAPGHFILLIYYPTSLTKAEPRLLYVDSLGLGSDEDIVLSDSQRNHQAVDDYQSTIFVLLKEAVGDNAVMRITAERLQRDNFSCGVWCVYAANQILKDEKSLPFELPKKPRPEVNELYEEYKNIVPDIVNLAVRERIERLNRQVDQQQTASSQRASVAAIPANTVQKRRDFFKNLNRQQDQSPGLTAQERAALLAKPKAPDQQEQTTSNQRAAQVRDRGRRYSEQSQFSARNLSELPPPRDRRSIDSYTRLLSPRSPSSLQPMIPDLSALNATDRDRLPRFFGYYRDPETIVKALLRREKFHLDNIEKIRIIGPPLSFFIKRILPLAAAVFGFTRIGEPIAKRIIDSLHDSSSLFPYLTFLIQLGTAGFMWMLVLVGIEIYRRLRPSFDYSHFDKIMKIFENALLPASKRNEALPVLPVVSEYDHFVLRMMTQPVSPEEIEMCIRSHSDILAWLVANHHFPAVHRYLAAIMQAFPYSMTSAFIDRENGTDSGDDDSDSDDDSDGDDHVASMSKSEVPHDCYRLPLLRGYEKSINGMSERRGVLGKPYSVQSEAYVKQNSASNPLRVGEGIGFITPRIVDGVSQLLHQPALFPVTRVRDRLRELLHQLDCSAFKMDAYALKQISVLVLHECVPNLSAQLENGLYFLSADLTAVFSQLHYAPRGWSFLPTRLRRNWQPIQFSLLHILLSATDAGVLVARAILSKLSQSNWHRLYIGYIQAYKKQTGNSHDEQRLLKNLLAMLDPAAGRQYDDTPGRYRIVRRAKLSALIAAYRDIVPALLQVLLPSINKKTVYCNDNLSTIFSTFHEHVQTYPSSECFRWPLVAMILQDLFHKKQPILLHEAIEMVAKHFPERRRPMDYMTVLLRALPHIGDDELAAKICESVFQHRFAHYSDLVSAGHAVCVLATEPSRDNSLGSDSLKNILNRIGELLEKGLTADMTDWSNAYIQLSADKKEELMAIITVITALIKEEVVYTPNGSPRYPILDEIVANISVELSSGAVCLSRVLLASVTTHALVNSQNQERLFYQMRAVRNVIHDTKHMAEKSEWRTHIGSMFEATSAFLNREPMAAIQLRVSRKYLSVMGRELCTSHGSKCESQTNFFCAAENIVETIGPKFQSEPTQITNLILFVNRLGDLLHTNRTTYSPKTRRSINEEQDSLRQAALPVAQTTPLWSLNVDHCKIVLRFVLDTTRLVTQSSDLVYQQEKLADSLLSLVYTVGESLESLNSSSLEINEEEKVKRYEIIRASHVVRCLKYMKRVFPELESNESLYHGVVALFLIAVIKAKLGTSDLKGYMSSTKYQRPKKLNSYGTDCLITMVELFLLEGGEFNKRGQDLFFKADSPLKAAFKSLGMEWYFDKMAQLIKMHFSRSTPSYGTFSSSSSVSPRSSGDEQQPLLSPRGRRS